MKQIRRIKKQRTAKHLGIRQKRKNKEIRRIKKTKSGKAMRK